MRKEYLKIRDFCEVFDGPHATPTKTDEGPFYLSISSLNRGTLDLSKSAHLSEQEFQKWTKRVTPRKGDLLFSYETRLGEAALMPDGVKACLGRRMGILRPDTQKVLPEYLLYSYIAPEFQNVISSNTITGATVDRLSLTDFPNFEMRIPQIDQQRHIVAILSALDAKIALNHRINGELEGMAKLLYDYWFVQYDFPLSAAQAAALGKPRLAGQPYRTSGGPMVYHEHLKREIPKGWEVSTVAETFKTHLGGTPSRKEPTYWNPGEIAWLSSGEKEQLFVSAPDETISRKGLANSAATLLPAGTVILSIVRHIRASILAIEAATNQSVLGIRETATIKHCFIYPFIMGEIPRYMILRTGAQQPHINKGTVDETPLVIPAAETLKAYTAIAAPIFEQIQNLQQQNQELTTLRDWLLPMLMNGQVRVG